MGQSSLAQAGRPIEEDVIQRFIPAPGSGYGYSQVFLGPVLTDKLIQAARPQAGLKGYILGGRFAGGNTLYGELPPL
jgi:hypothetical protein